MNARSKLGATIATVSLAALALAGCGSAAPSSQSPTATVSEGGDEAPAELTKVKLSLSWVVQGAAAAYISAEAEGFYEDAGLDVEIIAAGPDTRPAALLATGAIDFALTSPTTVITGREEGMPLVAVMTQNQEDGVNFLCKKSTGIDSWDDLKGRTVGVWSGGADTRAYYGVTLAGLSRDDVQWFPQKFSMTEFLEDKIDCAVAMAWNEVHVVLNAGIPASELNFLKVSDLGPVMVGDVAVTTEEKVAEDAETVQAFVDASLRGMAFMLDNPEKARDHVLALAPDLDADAQLMQVEETNRLQLAGIVATSGLLGDIDPKSWASEVEALLGAEVLSSEVENLDAAYDPTFVHASPAEIHDSVDRDAILARIAEVTGN
ncbi:MAG: ABC transporter substrate-binding protein [Actinomycetota bacterium]|nr:ABC transporter substrate-binding protein [Actinomycetota bacterium]